MLCLFLISQPLVYLIQVPFSSMGWGLFMYYKYWFFWTILCFPMGFVGYYMKKDKWWGYLILLPMIALTGLSYYRYFSEFQFSFPRYILITLFCAATVAVITVICLLNPPVYSVDLITNTEEHPVDDTCTVAFEDSSYGDIGIIYIDQFEDYAVHADLKKRGHTSFTVESPDGEKTEYDLTIERTTYEVTKK